MTDRRGPASGYNFGAKRHYRRALYSAVRRFWGNRMAGRTCAILPSIEGDEIEAAIRAGFHPRGIAIIDRNPAIVATLKRRHPLVTAIGVDAARAAARVVDAIGPVDFVNLDLCGPIGRTVYQTIDAWTGAGAIKAGPRGAAGLLAITVLRGRERGGQFKAACDINVLTPSAGVGALRDGTDLLREGALADRLNGFHLPTRNEWARGGYGVGGYQHGTYRSTAGSQSMLWTLFAVHARVCLCEWCLLTYMAAPAGWAPQARLDYGAAIRRKIGALLAAGVSEGTIRTANGIADDDDIHAPPPDEGAATWSKDVMLVRKRWGGAGPTRSRGGHG